MLFIFGLIPATILVIVGYFVLIAAARAEGALERFGRYLAIWTFVLAGLLAVGGLLAPTLGMQGPMGGMMSGGIAQHMQRMEQLEEEQAALLRDLQRD